MCIGKLCCRLDFLVCCVQSAVTDILLDGVGKKIGILQNDTQGRTQAVPLGLINIMPVNGDGAAVDIVKTRQQVDNCGFSCAGRADKGNGLPWSCVEVDVLQNGMSFLIGEADIC